jgi:hypothetical protein
VYVADQSRRDHGVSVTAETGDLTFTGCGRRPQLLLAGDRMTEV